MKRFIEKPLDQSKRNLLKGSVALAGGALGGSLPVSAIASAPRKPVYKAPLFDPTLENYPGYSTYVPVLKKG